MCYTFDLFKCEINCFMNKKQGKYREFDLQFMNCKSISNFC